MAVSKIKQFRWHKLFLARLAETADFTRSAKDVGVSVTTAKNHRHRYPEFAEACNIAIDQGCDRIEAALFAAGSGMEEPVVSGGEVVFAWFKDGQIVKPRTKGAERKPLMKKIFNVRAAEIILRAHRPERYGERINIAAAVKHDGEIKHSGTIGVHEAMKMIRSDPEMQQSAILIAKRLNMALPESSPPANGDQNGHHFNGHNGRN